MHVLTWVYVSGWPGRDKTLEMDSDETDRFLASAARGGKLGNLETLT